MYHIKNFYAHPNAYKLYYIPNIESLSKEELKKKLFENLKVSSFFTINYQIFSLIELSLEEYKMLPENVRFSWELTSCLYKYSSVNDIFNYLLDKLKNKNYSVYMYQDENFILRELLKKIKYKIKDDELKYISNLLMHDVRTTLKIARNIIKHNDELDNMKFYELLLKSPFLTLNNFAISRIKRKDLIYYPEINLKGSAKNNYANKLAGVKKCKPKSAKKPDVKDTTTS